MYTRTPSNSLYAYKNDEMYEMYEYPIEIYKKFTSQPCLITDFCLDLC